MLLSLRSAKTLRVRNYTEFRGELCYQYLSLAHNTHGSVTPEASRRDDGEGGIDGGGGASVGWLAAMAAEMAAVMAAAAETAATKG